jgi:hypothetical protein
MHRAGGGARRLTLWRWALLAGIGVIIVSLAFDQVPGIHACGVPNPILALEFVTTPAELAAQLPAYCRTEQIAAHRTALWLDALVFIPVYAAFLILALFALLRDDPRARSLVASACAAVLVAALLDQIEGTQLFALLDGAPPLALLWVAVRGKFVLLALATGIAGWLIMRGGGWRSIAGVVIFGGALISFAGLLGQVDLVMRGNSIAWMTLILFAAIRAFSRASAGRLQNPLP